MLPSSSRNHYRARRVTVCVDVVCTGVIYFFLAPRDTTRCWQAPCGVISTTPTWIVRQTHHDVSAVQTCTRYPWMVTNSEHIRPQSECAVPHGPVRYRRPAMAIVHMASLSVR